MARSPRLYVVSKRLSPSAARGPTPPEWEPIKVFTVKRNAEDFLEERRLESIGLMQYRLVISPEGEFGYFKW
jgi:hypothetical protein